MRKLRKMREMEQIDAPIIATMWRSGFFSEEQIAEATGIPVKVITEFIKRNKIQKGKTDEESQIEFFRGMLNANKV